MKQHLQFISLLFIFAGVLLIGVACETQKNSRDVTDPALATASPLLAPSPSATFQAAPIQAPTPTIDVKRRPGAGMTASAITPDGALWYAFDLFDSGGGSPPYSQNQGLFRLQDGHVSHFDVPGAIRVLKVAPDGSLYVGAGCGVFRFEADEVETLLDVDCDNPPSGPRLYPLDIAFTNNGLVWVGDAFSLASYDGATWKAYEIPANRIVVAPDGSLWTRGWDGRADSNCCLTHITAGEWTTYTWNADIPAGPEVLQSLFSQASHSLVGQGLRPEPAPIATAAMGQPEDASLPAPSPASEEAPLQPTPGPVIDSVPNDENETRVAQKDGQPANWTLYESKSSQYSIAFPATATLFEDEVPSVDGVMVPVSDTVTILLADRNYMVILKNFDLDKGTTLDDFVNTHSDCLEVAADNGQTTSLADLDFLVFQATACGPYGSSYYYTLVGDTGYRIEVASVIPMANIQVEVEAILQTFKPLPASDS